MSKVSGTLKKELHELLPPAVFFFIALHLVVIVRVLMLKGTGITVGTSASTTLAALVIAKAVLIADLLPFINRYPHKPLVYNIAWKTAIYCLVAALLQYLEHLVHYWRETGGLVAGNEKLLSEIVWPHFWAIQIFLLLLLLMYCTTREFVRVIGEERLRQIFFGPVPSAAVPG